MFLQTPESRILLDCGLNPAAASEDQQYPYLDAPEFKIDDLDAVIISHSHLDHVGLVPFLYKMGYRGPCYMTAPTRDIAALLALDYIEVAFKEAKKSIYNSADIKEMVKHTICLDYEEVSDITPDIRLTFYNAGHTIGCVTKDTMIVLADGSVKKINEVVGKPNPTPIQAISMNSDLKIMPSNGIAFKKIHNDSLYNIKTSVGELTATPEHPFFIIKNSEIKERRADELKNGDYIAVPKKININGKNQILQTNFQGTASNAKHIKIQKKTSPMLMQLIGYLLGDGCKIVHKSEGKRKPSITITLTDKNIQNLYSYNNLIKRLFGIKGKIIKTGKRRHELFVFCTEFARFLELNFSGILNYSPQREIPQIICKSTNEEIAKFLKGLFDAEASVGKDKIEISLTSKNIIEVIKIFLLRLGIISQQTEKKQYGYGKNMLHRLIITDRKSINIFSNLIEFSDINKKEKLDKLKNSSQHPKRKSMFGIPYIHNDLRYIRKKLRLGRKDFQIAIKHYESGKHKVSEEGLKLLLGRFKKHLDRLNQLKENFNEYNLWEIKEILRSSVYQIGNALRISPQVIHYRIKKSKKPKEIKIIRNILLKDLESILNDKKLHKSLNFLDLINKGDIAWREINIKKIKNNFKEVYDLSIPVHQSFISNGIISHNSAMSHLHIGNGLHNFLYSGDLKFGRTQLLESASTEFPRLETVAIESTYGGKENIMPARHECEAQVLKIIKDTIERKGKVLMPVLGVGRSQEVLLIIENAIRNKLLEEIPVYIHGMVWDITAIHTAYPDFLSKNVRKSIFHKDENPFLSPIFKRVGSKKEQDEIINEKGPCVIMATSGMLSGGPSVEYFKALAENPKNSLVLTCYQGVGSLGRRIQQGEKTFTFANGEKTEQFKMGMEVYTIDGLSGHSSRQELIRFVYSLNPKPKRILVNHGESSRCLDLSSSLHKINSIETSAPRNLESVRIK